MGYTFEETIIILTGTVDVDVYLQLGILYRYYYLHTGRIIVVLYPRGLTARNDQII